MWFGGGIGLWAFPVQDPGRKGEQSIGGSTTGR
jgi:hypothetical protein